MPKISSLTPIVSPDDDDVLPIVDDSATETKKMSLSTLVTWLQNKVAWIVGAMLEDNTVTADKFAVANYEYRRQAPSGTVDTTGTSFIDVITFTSLNIPTWATKAVFTWSGTGYPVTAVTDGVVELLIGSTDNTNDERVCYNSYPINTNFFFSAVNEVTLTGTGTQTLKLRARETAGTGAIRFTTSSVWTIKVEYF